MRLFKRLFPLVALLCALTAFSTEARATNITVTGFTLAGYNYGGSTASLRIYADRTFTTSTGTIVVQGTPGSTTFYKQVNCTVAGTTLTVPSYTIDTTSDALDDRQATFTFVLFDARAVRRDTIGDHFIVPPSFGLSVSFPQLKTYNFGAPTIPPRQTISYDQAAALVASQQFANPATTTSRGIGKVSVNVADPVFVETTDPRLSTASAVSCGGTDDTVALAAAQAAGNPISLPLGTTCASNSQTLSIAIFYEGGRFLPITGQTLTLTGPQIGDVTLQRYTNALAGQGTISITGNRYVSEMTPEMFGGKADNSTDNTQQVQAILDIFATAGKDPVVKFGAGKYVIAGALKDVSLSNAQIVLPKRTTLQSMLSVTFKGANAPSTPWNNDSGTILKSTLSSGNGVMIGVKNNQGSGTATASAYMSNASSNIYVALENITLQLPINPTNSALDISKTRNYDLRNVRIVTGDFAQGGANPVVSVGTVIPDLAVTIATTTTSYALNLPTNLPNNGNIDGLFIAGFYTGVRTGELTKGRNIVMHACNVGFQVEGAIWPSTFENVVIAATARPIKVTGAKPDQTGFPDTVNTATIFFRNFGVETDAVNPVIYIVDDANNYLGGTLQVYYGHGADLLLNPAYPPNLVITRSERPWNTREPITQILGPSSLTAVYDETKRGIPVSNDTWVAWKMLTNNQTGTSNGIGAFAYLNDAIADGLEKRLFMEYVTTDGAINSGKATLYIANGGTLNVTASFDRFLNFNLAGLLRGDEQTLTIASNTIAPTKMLVHIGAGLIKTITVPSGTAATVCFDAIPDAAYTYDATGNILVPGGGGTATVNRLMRFCYSTSAAKWVPSY